MRFLKAFKSLNSFRDFQVPLGNKGYLNKFDDITSWIKSRNSDMKKDTKMGYRGGPGEFISGFLRAPMMADPNVAMALQGFRGKRKDSAKFENIHIEKANIYISGEEKRTFVKF